MDVAQLQRWLVDYRASLFREGFLDDQFTRLHELQDESDPCFVSEMASLIFENSENLIDEMTRAMNQKVAHFEMVYAHVHKLKGSISNIGAQRVVYVCLTLLNNCKEQNTEGCLRSLQLLKNDRVLSSEEQARISLFKLEQQHILAAGGSIPVMKLSLSVAET